MEFRIIRSYCFLCMIVISVFPDCYATKWDRRVCFLFPPLTKIYDLLAIIILVHKSSFMNNKTRVILAGLALQEGFVKSGHDNIFDFRLPKPKKKKSSCVYSRESQFGICGKRISLS